MFKEYNNIPKVLSLYLLLSLLSLLKFFGLISGIILSLSSFSSSSFLLNSFSLSPSINFKCKLPFNSKTYSLKRLIINLLFFLNDLLIS